MEDLVWYVHGCYCKVCGGRLVNHCFHDVETFLVYDMFKIVDVSCAITEELSRHVSI